MPSAFAPAPPPPAEKLPFAVLTGFLGSGKTSFLARLLAEPDLADTAIIINEFGAVGLDHLLLESLDQDVLELPNGCVCCAVRQDLAETLYMLLRRHARAEGRPFRRIVLETSGLAEPAPILFTLSADAFLEASLRVETIVTAVDATHGLATLERFAEATAQAALADRLLLTKTDLAPASPELLARLAAMNPLAEIVDGQRAVPSATLFGGAPMAAARPRRAAMAAHSHGIAAHVLRLGRPMTRLAFAMALGRFAQAHGEDLLRCKGIVGFADRAGGPAAIHAVQHTMYPPVWLDDWPDADRGSRLVFILRGLAPALLLDAFAGGEPVLDPLREDAS